MHFNFIVKYFKNLLLYINFNTIMLIRNTENEGDLKYII